MPSGKTAVRGGDELVICRFPDGAARHLVTSHALGLKSKILTGDSHRSRKHGVELGLIHRHLNSCL